MAETEAEPLLITDKGVAAERLRLEAMEPDQQAVMAALAQHQPFLAVL
jgi:hypothetical protein